MTSSSEDVLRTLAAQVQQLAAELHELRSERAGESRSQAPVPMQVEPQNEEEDEEDAGDPDQEGWLAVLGNPVKETTTHHAVVFSKMLQEPPPLSAVRDALKKISR